MSWPYKSRHPRAYRRRRARPHKTDGPRLDPLRGRRERPRRRRAAEQRDELAPSHSMTSSARASTVVGISRPSAFAAFRLTTSSYLFGACTGRSGGFSPLRMRSTYSPHSSYQLWIAAGHRRRQANSLDAPRQCFSGYLLMNPSRLGIFTLGKVSAFIASFSPIILLSARI